MSQSQPAPKNNTPKFQDEQLTSEAINQHKKMAMGRPIPQDGKKVPKPTK